MTAKQIRKTKFECDDGAWEAAKWLQEIAAQLAETNERNKELLEFVHRKDKEAQEARKLVRLHPVRHLKRRRP
jgi:hypothetical protein